MEGQAPKCFYEELPKDTLIVGKYNILRLPRPSIQVLVWCADSATVANGLGRHGIVDSEIRVQFKLTRRVLFRTL